ncbi:MAG: hypothetical protein K5696_06020 [Lachnospiraceae bacterium]|nr:hypothetical protein [Lachnospiraceae bacterium]
MMQTVLMHGIVELDEDTYEEFGDEVYLFEDYNVVKIAPFDQDSMKLLMELGFTEEQIEGGIQGDGEWTGNDDE